VIPRRDLATVRQRLASSSAVVLLGPRQVGKTTLAREVADTWPDGATYLDLERPADQRRLTDADAYLRALAPRLGVLDEVHRVPALTETLRGVIDENRRSGFRHGQFLLLGSASLDVAGMSSESLAGRVSYVDFGGVNVDEAAEAGISADDLWVRGGFPDALTASDDEVSLRWRQDLVRSYLEREVPMFAPRIPATTLGRLWTMLAHGSGGLFNASRLAQALGVSSPTVARYVDLLADLGLVRRLAPWHANTSKRVTRAPKLHVRDSGLLHALLDIGSLDQLLGHPVAGQSYESFAVECLVAAAGDRYQPFHYRTARGDEVDLVLVRAGAPEIVVEIKRSTAPTVSAGFHRAVEDLGAQERYVVHPGDDRYPAGGVELIGLRPLVELLRSR
jgi:predicted AAA+ superfamily ATPase